MGGVPSTVACCDINFMKTFESETLSFEIKQGFGDLHICMEALHVHLCMCVSESHAQLVVS